MQTEKCLLQSPLFEISFVFVRFDHIASVIVNANHSEHRGDGKRFVVRADEKLTAFIELEWGFAFCLAKSGVIS